MDAESEKGTNHKTPRFPGIQQFKGSHLGEFFRKMELLDNVNAYYLALALSWFLGCRSGSSAEKVCPQFTTRTTLSGTNAPDPLRKIYNVTMPI